jgi:hypothetical protein
MRNNNRIRHPLQYPKDTVFFDKEKFNGKVPNKQIFAQPNCGWVTVYPVYLDKSKTRPQGRKVNQQHACQLVSASHIFEACRRLNLGRVLEVRSLCLSILIANTFPPRRRSLELSILEIGEDGDVFVFSLNNQMGLFVMRKSRHVRIYFSNFVRKYRKLKCQRESKTQQQLRRTRRKRKRRGR